MILTRADLTPAQVQALLKLHATYAFRVVIGCERCKVVCLNVKRCYCCVTGRRKPPPDERGHYPICTFEELKGTV